MPVTITETELDPFNIREKVTLRRLGDAIYDQFSANVVDPALDDLTDVNASAPSDGEVLLWNDADNVWEPGTVTVSGWKNVINEASITKNLSSNIITYAEYYATTGYPSNLSNVAGTIALSGLPEARGVVRVTILEAVDTSAYGLTVAKQETFTSGSIAPVTDYYFYTGSAVTIPFNTGAPANQAYWRALILVEAYFPA